MSRRNPHRRARIPKRRALSFRGAADVRGYAGTSRGGEPPWLLIAGGLGLLSLLFINRSAIVSTGKSLIGQAFDFAKASAFKAALPSGVARWSTQILSAAQRYGVDPWVLAGIMYIESHGGDAPGYTPKGDPGGTGDRIPRGPSGQRLPSGWVASKWATFANPVTGLPPDGKGWGRGLMQIDYGVHNAWVLTNPWWDAQTNINKGAELLKANLGFFRRVPAPGAVVNIEAWRLTTGMPRYGIEPWTTKYQASFRTSAPDPRPLSGSKLYEAAIVAHNTGTGGVLQALALGLPAEAPSTRQNYLTKFLGVVAPWIAKFSTG